jgi:CubicO group peptidase (beta-lactamase class C family)
MGPGSSIKGHLKTLGNLRAAWELVKSGAASGAFAGAVGIVSKNGKILLHEACGCSSIFPSKKRMQRDAIFDLASVTKAVATTTAILLLVERGKIGLDSEIDAYLGGFAGADWKKSITVEHLLTHTSGLPAWNDFYTRHETRESVVEEIFTKVVPVAMPGTAFQYSDIGFMILGQIIETVSGKKLDAFTKHEIFLPLGMKDTCYNPSTKLKERFVSTEYSNWRGKFLRGEVHDENAFAMGGVSGHAGLFSTALDLSKFCEQFCGAKSLLSSGTVGAMASDHTSSLGGYLGLGWWVKTGATPNIGSKLPEHSFGHNGYTGTSLWIDPEAKLSIILLTNRVHPVREGEPSTNTSVGIMMQRKTPWSSVNRAFQDAVVTALDD